MKGRGKRWGIVCVKTQRPKTAEIFGGDIFRTSLIRRLKKHRKSISITEKPVTNSYHSPTVIIIVAGVRVDMNGLSLKLTDRKP